MNNINHDSEPTDKLLLEVLCDSTFIVFCCKHNLMHKTLPFQRLCLIAYVSPGQAPTGKPGEASLEPGTKGRGPSPPSPSTAASSVHFHAKHFPPAPCNLAAPTGRHAGRCGEPGEGRGGRQGKQGGSAGRHRPASPAGGRRRWRSRAAALSLGTRGWHSEGSRAGRCRWKRGAPANRRLGRRPGAAGLRNGAAPRGGCQATGPAAAAALRRGSRRPRPGESRKASADTRPLQRNSCPGQPQPGPLTRDKREGRSRCSGQIRAAEAEVEGVAEEKPPLRASSEGQRSPAGRRFLPAVPRAELSSDGAKVRLYHQGGKNPGDHHPSFS